jgi:hypothetical protein
MLLVPQLEPPILMFLSGKKINKQQIERKVVLQEGHYPILIIKIQNH